MDFIGYNPNQSVISEFYDVEFTELKPVNVLVVTPSTSIPTETSTQVSSTIIIDNPSTISDSMMTRDVIVKLRIGLGEGRNSDDFSTTFPYGKIT
jgi:hypothetical protein